MSYCDCLCHIVIALCIEIAMCIVIALCIEMTAV